MVIQECSLVRKMNCKAYSVFLIIAGTTIDRAGSLSILQSIYKWMVCVIVKYLFAEGITNLDSRGVSMSLKITSTREC